MAVSPFWDWFDHVVVAATATGAFIVWTARALLVPGVKKQIDDMLAERFAEAKAELDQRHADNRKDLERLARQLQESTEDRKALHQQLYSLMEELSYLRGRTSGKFRAQEHE